MVAYFILIQVYIFDAIYEAARIRFQPLSHAHYKLMLYITRFCCFLIINICFNIYLLIVLFFFTFNIERCSLFYSISGCCHSRVHITLLSFILDLAGNFFFILDLCFLSLPVYFIFLLFLHWFKSSITINILFMYELSFWISEYNAQDMCVCVLTLKFQLLSSLNFIQLLHLSIFSVVYDWNL